jgi:nicotinamide mononucleotide transporter
MPPLELVAAAFGLANSLLLARRSVWNFPFGMAMVSLYALVFLEARLLSAVMLQMFFLVTQAWGWWQWRRVANSDDVVPVEALSTAARLAAGAAILALTTALALLTSWIGNAAAVWHDAANTSVSVTAQVLTMARRVEAWPLWVLVNLLSIVLYASQKLWITTGLYVIFLVLALWIWRLWRRAS